MPLHWQRKNICDKNDGVRRFEFVPTVAVAAENSNIASNGEADDGVEPGTGLTIIDSDSWQISSPKIWIYNGEACARPIAWHIYCPLKSGT